jgi:hypothetical protein
VPDAHGRQAGVYESWKKMLEMLKPAVERLIAVLR